MVEFFCRFASLRGGTTKQSRNESCYLDCFVPRSDVKRLSYIIPQIMEMRPESLEGGFVQLFLELRMGNGDDELGTLLQRTSIEVDGTGFRDEPVDVVAGGDST